MALRKLWLPLAVAGAVWWWTRPAAESAPVVEDEVRIVALAGAPLEDAMAEGRCGEMLDEVMSRPSWTFGVTTAGWSCMGPPYVVTYEIHGDGTVAYTENGFTRTLRLDAYEEAVLHDLGKLECNTPVGHNGLSMEIVPGSPSAEPGRGASVESDSLFGITLQNVLDRAVERRHWERIHLELAPIELHVRSGKYRFSIDDETLRVHRGRRLVYERAFFRHELVDLVDHVIGSATPERGDEAATGTLTAGGISYPVRFDAWERGPLAPLADALSHVRSSD